MSDDVPVVALKYIDEKLHDAAKQLVKANDKLDDVTVGLKEIRDNQELILEHQGEHTTMLRGVVDMKNAVIGINVSTRYVAGAVILMASALVAIAITCVVAITKVNFSSTVNALGQSATMNVGK